MINKIHTFGTSFTAGGGFEFFEKDFKYLKNRFKKQLSPLEEGFLLYENIEGRKTQFDCSWPGQLQTFLNEKTPNISVENHAKCGYGNERLYRKVFDVVTHKDFQKNKSLLILEFSFMMRKEVYLREFNDYIICNYHFKRDSNGELELDGPNMAHTWHLDSDEKITKLQNHSELFHDFFSLTMEENNIIQSINKNITFLLSFLDKNKIKYLTTSSPLIDPKLLRFTDYSEDKKVMFQKDNKVTEYLESFIEDNKLDIGTETDGVYDDFHAGIQGNREIAKQVFNKLVDENYINFDKLKSDFNFKTFTKSII